MDAYDFKKKLSLVFLLAFAFLVLPLISAVNLQSGTILNTTISNTSMTFNTVNITVSQTTIQTNSILLENVSYVNGNLRVNISTTINLTSVNTNLDSAGLPYLTVDTSTSKHIASNLTQSVNATTIVNGLDTTHTLSTITLNGVVQQFVYSSGSATITAQNINPGDNTLSFSYLLVDQGSCTTALSAFQSYPVLIGLIGTIFLIGLVVLFIFGYNIVQSGQEVTASQVGIFFTFLIGVAVLIIVGIIMITSLCSVGVI